jgi:monoterpene epsilon-lactone hydrolase
MPSLRARMLNALFRLTVKPIWRPGLGIAAIRAHAARTDARLARRPLACDTESVTVAGLPARWFGAADLAVRNGTLMYLHGGAWCIHLPALYARFAATLTHATGLRVLLVDYRLAPEHSFPAAVDDCLAVYRDLVDATGAAPSVVAGDSAGGSLTLVTMMRARDEHLPLPGCAVLLSPSTDLTLSGPSARYNAIADPMFSDAAGDLLPELYCPGQDRSEPLLSPLFGNWAGLPPLYFIAGSTEILLDDSVRAHDRALQAGTPAVIDVWRDVPHVFPVFGFLPEAREAVTKIAEFVRQHARTHRSLADTRDPAYATVGLPASSADARHGSL